MSRVITIQRRAPYRDREVYEVGGGMDAKGPPLLDIKAVAAVLGVQPKTVSQYLTESKVNARTGKPGRYVGHPFPAPDGNVGKSPWWALNRADEIREWDAQRVGQGRGGGPKPRNQRGK